MTQEGEPVMSESAETGISRRYLLEAAGAAAVAAVGLAGPAAAATPDPVPFKATSKHSISQVTMFTIPVDPPRVVETFTTKGTASLLGDMTFAEHHVARLDEKGVPRSITDGIGVFTAANGDAIFASHHSLLRLAEPGFLAEGAFTITGGRGSYCGAVGSGRVSAVVDIATGEITFNWDGMIQMPPK
jgi:hypothetical protein